MACPSAPTALNGMSTSCAVAASRTAFRSSSSHSGRSVRSPADAAGSASFRYKADDGRGGQAEATVVLTVSAAGTNRAPVQKRPSTTSVEDGKTTTYNVLTDWNDPDGDDLAAGEEVPAEPQLVHAPLPDSIFTDGKHEVGQVAFPHWRE